MQVLITPRLTLRPPLPPDIADITAGISNLAVARMLSSPPWPYEEKHAAEWIGRCRANKNDMVFTIHRERLIGVVSVEWKDDGAEPELGYWLAQPWWGSGFMTEAASALLAHTFATSPVEAVVSGAFADNPASLRIQEKLGFTTTGVNRLWSKARNAGGPGIRTRLTRERHEAMAQADALAAAC